eukprot:TRINITY_DN37068_c0_g1_i1.p1 TRINITY_DN37068_c0_g1~~TRINITY_DN37068_c0_g1_i1.p1  ORF type:complete len:479 (+),score=79.79 TRINITY_DN37068_c0_g1_i1:67-1503(+)
MAYPFTEVAGGMLPPTRHDLVVRVKIIFGEEDPMWSVGRVVDMDSDFTPRELVAQQIEIMNEKYKMDWDPEEFVLQANEAPGVVIESVECPLQRIVDFPWVATKVLTNYPVELRLARYQTFTRTVRQGNHVKSTTTTEESVVTQVPDDDSDDGLRFLLAEFTTKIRQEMTNLHKLATSKLSHLESRVESSSKLCNAIRVKIDTIEKPVSDAPTTPQSPVEGGFLSKRIEAYEETIEGLQTTKDYLSVVSSAQAVRESALQERIELYENRLAGYEEQTTTWVRSKLDMMGRYLSDFTDHTNNKLEILAEMSIPKELDKKELPTQSGVSIPRSCAMSDISLPKCYNRTVSPMRMQKEPPQDRRAARESLFSVCSSDVKRPPSEERSSLLASLEADLIAEQTWTADATRETVLSHREAIPSKRSTELYTQYYKILSDGGHVAKKPPPTCDGYKQDWSKPVCVNCGASRSKCPARNKGEKRG